MSKGSGGTRSSNSRSTHSLYKITANSSVYEQADYLDKIAVESGYNNSVKFINENKPQIEIDAIPGSHASEYIRVGLNTDGSFHIKERGNRPDKADSFEDYTAQQVESHIKAFKKYYDWYYAK